MTKAATCPVCKNPDCPEDIFRQWADEQSGNCDLPEVKSLRHKLSARDKEVSALREQAQEMVDELELRIQLEAENKRLKSAIKEIKESVPYASFIYIIIEGVEQRLTLKASDGLL